MNTEQDIKKIFADDVKLIVATVTIVLSIAGTWFTLSNQVSLLSQKVSSAVALIKEQQATINSLVKDDAVRDSRIASLETVLKIR